MRTALVNVASALLAISPIACAREPTPSGAAPSTSASSAASSTSGVGDECAPDPVVRAKARRPYARSQTEIYAGIATPDAAWIRCASDDDCALLDVGVCHACGEGTISVRKDSVDAARERYASSAEARPCRNATRGVDPPACLGAPIPLCNDNACTWYPGWEIPTKCLR